MRILPVIDLLSGAVVRGVAGNRAKYRPIVSPLVSDARPDTVARAFHERFGFSECYVADLDAIAGRPGNYDAWRQITDAGFQLWLDAGIGTIARAEDVLRALDSSGSREVEHRLVIGLESLASLTELGELVKRLGRQRIVFSLDLKDGELLACATELQRLSPGQVVTEAVQRGIERLIVLDLADVGANGGTRTLDLCRKLRLRHSNLELVAGGGVRNVSDLQRLAEAGCAVALVASALHDGQLSPENCRVAEGWQ